MTPELLYCPYSFLTVGNGQYDLFVVVKVQAGVVADFSRLPFSSNGTSVVYVDIRAQANAPAGYNAHRYSNLRSGALATDQFIEVYRPALQVGTEPYAEFRIGLEYALAESLNVPAGSVATHCPYVCALRKADDWTNHTPHVLLPLLDWDYSPIATQEKPNENFDSDSNNSTFTLNAKNPPFAQIMWVNPLHLQNYFEPNGDKLYEGTAELSTEPPRRTKMKNRKHGTQPGLWWAFESHKRRRVLPANN